MGCWKCFTRGKNRRTNSLPVKSAGKNTTVGVITTLSSTPRKSGRKFLRRNSVMLYSKLTNKDDKNALSHESLPTAKGILIWISFRAMRSWGDICDECLHSGAYINATPFGGYATTRKCNAFSRMALNINHSATSQSFSYPKTTGLQE